MEYGDEFFGARPVVIGSAPRDSCPAIPPIAAADLCRISLYPSRDGVFRLIESALARFRLN